MNINLIYDSVHISLMNIDAQKEEWYVMQYKEKKKKKHKKGSY